MNSASRSNIDNIIIYTTSFFNNYVLYQFNIHRKLLQNTIASQIKYNYKFSKLIYFIWSDVSPNTYRTDLVG